MSTASDFKPKSLTASEYILDLFHPAENVAVVVRHRATGKAIQRIARAETVAGPSSRPGLPIKMRRVRMCMLRGIERGAPRHSSLRARKISFAFSKTSP